MITLDPKREKIANKIKELMKKTTANGCSEAEALSAAEMVGKLMNEYDLSMTEIEFKNEEFLTMTIETDSRVASPIHNVVTAIGVYTDCKVWFSRGSKIVYSFFGTKRDTEIAHFLYNLLLGAIKRETENYKKTDSYKKSTLNGRTKTSSFANGMGIRLASRLQEMKRDQKVENSNSTALVKVDKMSIVLDQFSKLNMRLKTSVSKTKAGSYDAYRAGQAAGDRVNINAGLSGSNTNKTLRLK
jgi:hypothetical protein